MHIEFRTKALEACFETYGTGVKRWGGEVAHRYIHRVGILKDIKSTQDLRRFPSLRYHRLKGRRKGQHAVWLTRRWRLIFTLHGEDLTIVRIEEVSKHYGD